MGDGGPFFVRGLPAPQGSKRAYVRGGRAMLVESSSKVKPWRADVRAAAESHITGLHLGPVVVTLLFVFDRPLGQFGKRGLLPSAPPHKTTAPDVDKLARSTLDALTGIAFRDDSQVVGLAAYKQWTDAAYPVAGCSITVNAA